VDDEGLAGDERRAVAVSEEDDGAGDLFGPPDAAEGGSTRDLGEAVLGTGAASGAAGAATAGAAGAATAGAARVGTAGAASAAGTVPRDCAAEHRGIDVAWQDGVHADALRAELLGGRPTERHQRALAGGVCGQTGRGRDRVDRADVDDRAAGPLEVGQGLPD